MNAQRSERRCPSCEAALYLRTIILRDHVSKLPEELHEPYVRAIIRKDIARNGAPFTADYVRLNLWARRPASP